MYPVIADPALEVSILDDNVNAGAAGLIVIEYVRLTELVALVAVIVYALEDADAVGVPEINPVAASKESPGEFEIAGEIE